MRRGFSALGGGVLAGVLHATSLRAGNGWLAWIALVPLLLVVERTSARCTIVAAVAYALTLVEVDVTPWLTTAAARYLQLDRSAALLLVATGVGAVGVAFGLLLGVMLTLRRPGILWCAALWSVWESLHGLAPPNLPVTVLATAQRDDLALLQLASVTGVAGVSALIVAANVTVARLAAADRSWRARLGSLAAVVGVTLAVAAWGAARLGRIPSSADGPPVLLIDGNAADVGDSTLARYVAATPLASEPRPALVVWPESALPIDLETDRAAWARLSAFVVELGATLATGGLHADAGDGARRFNSLHVIAPRHGMLSYHKRVLVPFAEAWPALFGTPPRSLDPVQPGRDVMVFGDGDGRWGPLICFEIGDAASARAIAGRGARFLVNVSNDVWFGAYEAPHELWTHVRAIETGLPVVRAANAGVSEVVDAGGRVVARGRAAGAPAVLSARIPRPVDTVYVRTGEVFLPACVVVIVVGMAPVARRLKATRRASRSCPS